MRRLLPGPQPLPVQLLFISLKQPHRDFRPVNFVHLAGHRGGLGVGKADERFTILQLDVFDIATRRETVLHRTKICAIPQAVDNSDDVGSEVDLLALVRGRIVTITPTLVVSSALEDGILRKSRYRRNETLQKLHASSIGIAIPFAGSGRDA